MEKETKFETEQASLRWFDPMLILRDVSKRWAWILLVAVAVTVGTYIFSDLTYKPVYQSSATFVVTNTDSAATVYNDLESTANVALVFEDLLNGVLLREKILPYVDGGKFTGTITTAVVPETNLLTVTVSAPDPRTAFQVLQAIIDHHEELTYKVVDDVLLELLQEPVVPTAPSNSAFSFSQMKKLLFFAIAGAALVAAVASCVSNTIRSGSEARAKLDCTYLGEIPHERKYRTLRARLQRRSTNILITNPLTGFAFTEAIRKLRRRVEQYSKGRKVLMVTSLLENEGKSTVATNLAVAMARKQERVLLIECDLRKPACYRHFGQHMGEHGLRDVLTDHAQLKDVLCRDKKSGLYMLLERKGDGDAGDLLAGKTMRELIRWARNEFDCVILDLPPMAAVSDAECVAEYADACILVVRQNTADATALNRAIARLERGKAKLLGCVLNNVQSGKLIPGVGYGYGYGYGYGCYGHYGKYGHYGHYGKYSDTGAFATENE